MQHWFSIALELSPIFFSTVGAFFLANGLKIEVPEADKEYLAEEGTSTTVRPIQRPCLIKSGLGLIVLAAVIQSILVVVE